MADKIPVIKISNKDEEKTYEKAIKQIEYLFKNMDKLLSELNSSSLKKDRAEILLNVINSLEKTIQDSKSILLFDKNKNEEALKKLSTLKKQLSEPVKSKLAKDDSLSNPNKENVSNPSFLDYKTLIYEGKLDSSGSKQGKNKKEVKLKKAKDEFDEIKQFLAKEYSELEKFEEKHKVKATEQRTQLIEIDNKATKKYEDAVEKANKEPTGIFGKAAKWGENQLNKAKDLVSPITSLISPISGYVKIGMKAWDVGKKIFTLNSNLNKEIDAFKRELVEIAEKYDIIRIGAIKNGKSISDSLFSTDLSNRLTKGMDGYNAAIQKEQSLMEKLGNTHIVVGKKKKKFMGLFNYKTVEITESVLTGYKKVLGTEEDLIDKTTGRINKDMANALLNSGKLRDDAKKTIENILAAQEAADAAMAQVNEVLQSVAGNIGTSLQTALVDAFKAGTSEAEVFGKSISDILENWIAQTMFSAVFGSQLKELEDRMKKTVDNDGDISEDIVWFYKNYQSGVDKFNKGLFDAKKQIKDSSGLDIFSTDIPQPTTGKGLASITQDSANQLNGSFENMLRYTSAIHDNTEQSLLVHRTMQSQLNRIADNTEYCRYLENVKNSLEEIQTKGVKLKS
ncbi:hypothetical protein [Prevotella sp. 10(H)]|uniref:hypothetical protein n=1 Tax=Prevotella sp. 10(H) TaxID=1158294 RepID=UPI0004A6DF14|nr:hypothetical protein [Prevotella sp. 10(H)]